MSEANKNNIKIILNLYCWVSRLCWSEDQRVSSACVHVGGSVCWRIVSTTSVWLEHLRSYCCSARCSCSLHYRRLINCPLSCNITKHCAPAPSGVQGKAPGHGIRWNWKQFKSVKCAISPSGFDYLTFWWFPIFRPLLLACYIAMPLMQKHILGGKTNLLESCFGGWIIHIWGLSLVFEGLIPK